MMKAEVGVNKYSQIGFLFLSVLFIRFPFFFRDYIDQDESTFILMGQSIADGHLPYEHLWDLKPPLLFYFFGFIETLFPDSFVAIRFVGVLIIFASALLLLKIARQQNLRNGFFIALGYIILSSEFGSLQGVMSEHFAVLFLLAGTVFFLRRTGKYDFLFAGMAFGCAVLCKLNYGYAIAALLILQLVTDLKTEKLRVFISAAVAVTLGIVITCLLVAMPFVVSGKSELLINAAFLAPLEYSRASHYSWGNKLQATWWLIAGTILLSFLALKISERENKNIVLACIAVLTGTVYTFYSSGIVNGHYLVQLYPFLLLLLFGIIIRKTIRIRLVIVALVVLLISEESILEYYRLLSTRSNPAEYRPGFEVVHEIKKRKLDHEKIFFADYHIAYWMLHQYPLTKSTTHPSNLARPYLFRYYNQARKSSAEELQFLLEQLKPKLIVSKSEDLYFFDRNSPENIYFRKIVKEHYHLIYQDPGDRIHIWQRK